MRRRELEVGLWEVGGHSKRTQSRELAFQKEESSVTVPSWALLRPSLSKGKDQEGFFFVH